MRAFAGFLQRRSGAILIAALLLSVVASLKLPPRNDDDVIRFLPQNDPEVQRLNEIGRRFKSIHVALVGVQTDGLFTAEHLAYVRKLAAHLKGVPEVANVTSLTELAVVDAGAGGSDYKDLVPGRIPTDAAALDALRKDVLSKDYLVGSLVSADGTATRLICQLNESIDGKRVSPTEAARNLRTQAESIEAPAGTRLHYGGAPFIAEAAATGSQKDLMRLGPWVVGVIVLLIVLTLGTFRAAVLALSVVGLGILWTVGLMCWLDKPFTLISSSLPVMLVALGSAFAVHILVWYLDHEGDVTDVLEKVGGPVIVSALTSMAGFVSFLLMDIAPMREFGWQMAVGSAILCVIAVVVIPAFLYRFPMPVRPTAKLSGRVDDWLVRLGEGTRLRWGVVLAVAAVITGVFAWEVPHIRTRMDTRSFFEEGSDPDLADRFMTEQFGGSVFLQVLVDGDMQDPAVLRQMAAFEDRLEAVPGVTRVESITKVLALVNEAYLGRRELERTRKAVAYHGSLAKKSDPAVDLLVDDAWSGAVIQVAIGGFDTDVVTRVTDDIRKLAADHLPGAVIEVARSDALLPAVIKDAAQRIVAVARRPELAEPVMDALVAVKPSAASDVRAKVAKVLKEQITEDETVLVKEGTDLGALGAVLSADIERGALTAETLAQRLSAIADPTELEDKAAFGKATRVVYGALSELAAEDVAAPVVAKVMGLLGTLGDSARLRVSAIVGDVLAPTWVVADPKGASITAVVSGYPIVQEAMTRSVHKNHARSIAFAIPIVLLIMYVVFRSIVASIVALIPSAVTLILTFGMMGHFGDRLPLDIGASMLASIAIGTGIDYAVHFLWRYRESDLSGAMRTTGRRILINAFEVTLGFIVLAWASIVPMSRFGILTAHTLLVAAIATLVLLPAMLFWWKPEVPPQTPIVEGEP